MKRSIKRIVAVMVAMMICSSFAFTVVHADAYDHIGFDTMGSYCTKGATQQLTITAYDGSGDVVAFSGDVTYSSSNENVVTINAGGTMTARDYGYAIVTATCGTLTARMVITVTPKIISESSCNSPATSIKRRGAGAKELTVGDLSYAKNDNGSNSSHYAAATTTFHWPANQVRENANMISEGWFYDNGGTTEKAEAAIGFRRYNDYTNSGAIGVIKSTDTTYKICSAGGRWDQIWDNASSTDTGIPRVKGWHQVTLVELNPAGNVQGKADIDKVTVGKPSAYQIYLDGQVVKHGESTHTVRYQVYGYAGFTRDTVAYFDDGMTVHYMQVNGVTLTTDPTDNETLVADVDYVGYSGTSAQKAYKWYYADSSDAAVWTEIAGATQSSYTPQDLPSGSYVKAGVVVTETIGSTSYTTEEHFSDPIFIFDGTYDHISLGKNAGHYTKGATNQQLSLIGYALNMEELTIDDLTGATFSSSNENVVAVTNSGLLTAVDYGIATVTATYQGLTASMLITVTSTTYETMSGNGSAFTRTGSNTRANVGGTHAAGESNYDYKYVYASYGWLMSLWISSSVGNSSNIVTNVWFYDNGSSDDSVAAVYMSSLRADPGTRAIGIINSSDTTYKLTGKGARRAKSDQTTPRYDDHVGICDSVTATLVDTGIERTKGWHQVSFIKKSADNVIVADGNNGTNYRGSDYYDIYLDGQFVHREIVNMSFIFLYGYAGYDGDHTAYFADASVVQYIGVEDVALTESNSTFTVGHTYYGTTGEQTNTYKWQTSDDGVTGWTDIIGATSGTYTPTVSTRNKYVRGLVSVTAGGVTTGYEASAAARPNFSLISATPSATEVNVSLRIANDTGASIPYALLIGYYNAAETEIVAFDSQVSTVASGSSKITHTFTIPEAIRGNFSKARIFLWEDINQATPYTQDILAE